MAIFDMMTEQEVKAFETLVNWNGARNKYKSMNTSVEHVLRFWESAKSDYLFEMMGENLIIEKEINYNKAPEEIAIDIRNCDDMHIFRNDWEVFANSFFDNGENYCRLTWRLRDMISESSLASNRWSYDNFTVPMPGGKEYVVSNGCKLSKAIGKIANAYHIRGYEEFRIAHSQCLNEKTLKGTLCLSIHPLDFATMSDNDCGWSSCMSWIDHGDYRQGTVEMMNSPCVVMAYLKSASDYMLSTGCYGQNKLAWNSKRWRELFIVERDAIMGIKGYPYWNRNLEEIVLDWIKELVAENLPTWNAYDNELADFNAEDHIVDFYGKEDTIPFSTNTYLMYNDCYSHHSGYVSVNRPEEIEFSYSGVSECLCCGGELYNWDTESDLFCDDCDHTIRCEECGDYIEDGEGIEIDGRVICNYCYSEYVRNCEDCCDEHFEGDMVQVYFALDPQHIDASNYIYLCNDCYWKEKYFKTEDIQQGRIHAWQWVDYVCLNDLTDEGKEIFNYDSELDKYRYQHPNWRADESIEFTAVSA